ncbi:DUF262 domain-containing protein [Pseudomonas maumuensis]|uniref:DUF262 domain-containing HNH endonuclease family protein n=1 Tax=Pseudomonas maumuensis TaxID=2842354 RepID=A0ABX8NSB1_9PSED|nr:DUF262 domain-containing HNH endonuclease family protein [Pseudomonas maumuensis]QXH58929.1 DUF262 domain-containing HNH endonuclease family protein [Pseudomonas maumuensis]
MPLQSSLNIQRLLADKQIVVPDYQRAYAWDIPSDSSRSSQVDVFLADLERHQLSHSRSPYYFGHFLFERTAEKLHIIDGQQRLTTITLFLQALICRLRTLRALNEEEESCVRDMIRCGHLLRFQTIDYDRQVMNDVVFDGVKIDYSALETKSALRILRAFDYFTQQLRDKPLAWLVRMLAVVAQARCTAHLVHDKAEAIQMFIFQNNRGKRPSNLEVTKAQFMYAVHLRAEDPHLRERLIEDLNARFGRIYKAIASTGYRIDEDDVLLYTLRVQHNSLWESAPLESIEQALSSDDALDFIQRFVKLLEASFVYLSAFFGRDEKEHFAIHSLVCLGSLAIALPFIIKAYRQVMPMENINALCSAFEGLLLRHRLIGSRADLTSRLNDVFATFCESDADIQPLLDRIAHLKSAQKGWWAFWNDAKLEEALEGDISHASARHLLWKYEVHLEGEGQQGYHPRRFDRIERPELEHIAPRSEPSCDVHGYGEYSEDFRSLYLNCLGNYLLLSKSHNCAVGNIPFARKLATYNHSAQQREIQSFLGEDGVWGMDAIDKRHERMVGVLMQQL